MSGNKLKFSEKCAFSSHLGIETLKGGRVCRLKIRKVHLNEVGSAHGGALFTLADRAFACAVNTKGRVAVSMEMKINYLNHVREGDLIETSVKVLKEGKRTTVGLVEIKKGRQLIAVMLATGFNIGLPES